MDIRTALHHDAHNAVTAALNAACPPLPELHSTPAGQDDIEQIEQILQQRAPRCIPLDREEIRDRLDQFQVVRNGDLVVANVALQPLDSMHRELCSLAVAPGWEGLHLGSQLVSWAQDEARLRELALLCVTTSRRFFSRHGFEAVPMQLLPEKAARERCPICADRIAMQWIPEEVCKKWTKQ